MAAVQKQDSNSVGLRIAEEASYKVLPGTPIWDPYEPNTFDEFGGEFTNVARNPINDGRQRQKGVLVDLDASGGFQSDFTQNNLQKLLQGYFFADLRRKAEAGPNTEANNTASTTDTQAVTITDINGGTEDITFDSREALSAVVAAGGTGYVVGDVVTVSGGTSSVAATFTVTGETGGVVDTVSVLEVGRYSTTPANPAATTGGTGTGLTLTVTYGDAIVFQVGDLLLLSGNNNTQNDGLKRVTVVTGGNVVTVAEDLVTDASPAATAKAVTVGFQGTAGDIDVDASGTLPTLTSTTLDFTTLGLVPGEWIFVGGDAAANKFTNAVNNGFARVKTIAANVLTLDKTQSTMVTEASTTETIRLFFGRVLKNETGTLIKRRSYQLERTLGAPDDALPAEIQSEYVIGAIPNEATFNLDTADKLTVDLSFVAADVEQRSGATGVKSGTRPTLVSEDAYNTSNDFTRLKMSILDPADSNPTQLFAFITDATVSINNNITPNKAISVLGAFEATAGDFEVGAELSAYFSDVAALSSIRANDDITFDMSVVRGTTGNKTGWTMDIPLVTLGNGRVDVVKDEPVTLPLTSEAGADRVFNHTLLMTFYDLLPDAADT